MFDLYFKTSANCPYIKVRIDLYEVWWILDVKKKTAVSFMCVKHETGSYM